MNKDHKNDMLRDFIAFFFQNQITAKIVPKTQRIDNQLDCLIWRFQKKVVTLHPHLGNSQKRSTKSCSNV